MLLWMWTLRARVFCYSIFRVAAAVVQHSASAWELWKISARWWCIPSLSGSLANSMEAPTNTVCNTVDCIFRQMCIIETRCCCRRRRRRRRRLHPDGFFLAFCRMIFFSLSSLNVSDERSSVCAWVRVSFTQMPEGIFFLRFSLIYLLQCASMIVFFYVFSFVLQFYFLCFPIPSGMKLCVVRHPIKIKKEQGKKCCVETYMINTCASIWIADRQRQLTNTVRRTHASGIDNHKYLWRKWTDPRSHVKHWTRLRVDFILCAFGFLSGIILRRKRSDRFPSNLFILAWFLKQK